MRQPIDTLLAAILGMLLLGFGPARADAGEQRQSLDGKWDFTTNPLTAGVAPVPNTGTAVVETTATPWDTITVPGNWDVLPAYSTFVGKGWYRRTFTVPADWKGKYIRLHFDAVYHDAEVTLNGAVIGTHVGGYTPFEFDVTDKVHFGGENTVLVSADNTTRRGAWWHWGGISRTVELLANNDVRIVWQHISSVPDLTSGTAKVSVHYELANTSATEQKVKLSSKIKESALPESETEVTVPANAVAHADLSFALPKSDVKLWDFDHPNLYHLDTRIANGAETLHAKNDRFGIRKVEVKPEGLWLNGEQVRLTGFNRVSDSNETGNTEPDALVHADIDMMKRAGANMSRLMHVAQAPNLLDYLDEKGMLIFEEIPVWSKDDPNVIPDNPLTRQWLRETINRDYNHPCIIGWSPGNELRNHVEYVKSMFAYIRSDLDTTRLLSYASNSANKGTRENDPATFCDIIMENSYGGFSATLDHLHATWPEKPIFFSEWGVKFVGTGPDAKIFDFAKNAEDTMKDRPYVIGFSIWTFNDYRSAFKGTPPSGNREWGVVGVDRKTKAAYAEVRKAFSPVHSLTVKGGKVRIEPRSREEIPSYTLRGYTVHWMTLPKNNENNGTIPVPDLTPGDPPWEAPLPKGGAVMVKLISPTGYIVDQWGGYEISQ